MVDSCTVQVVSRGSLAQRDELWGRPPQGDDDGQGDEGQGHGACPQGLVQEIEMVW